jgi:biopolymer transport protein ExbD
MRRHRQELQPFTEMNVTNLLDTAFTLLMAFMIVAPSIKHGIDLEMPQTSGQIIDKDETKTITVIIERADEDGGEDRVYIEDSGEQDKARRVTLEELSRDLELQKMTHPKLDVFLEVDRRVTYEAFAKTLGTIKDSGIEDVGLVTEPLPSPPSSRR